MNSLPHAVCLLRNNLEQLDEGYGLEVLLPGQGHRGHVAEGLGRILRALSFSPARARKT